MDDIREVFSVSRKAANILLEKGYRLLSVQGESFWKPSPIDDKQVGMIRRPVYIVGRPDGVEKVDMPRF